MPSDRMVVPASPTSSSCSTSSLSNSCEVDDDDDNDDDHQSEDLAVCLHYFSKSNDSHKLLGRRKQRLTALRSGALITNNNLLRSCHNVQMECLAFSNNPFSVIKLKRPKMRSLLECKPRDDEVVIAIEATAICSLDVALRRGVLSDSLTVPFVLGSNFVGVVQTRGRDVKGFAPGTRVTSIRLCGGNARLIAVPAQELFTVHKRLDPAEVACVISTYLPVFQALHHGIRRPHRYSTTCLQHQRILITGARSWLEVQAITWLARHAGAKEVFVLASKEVSRLESTLAILIEEEDLLLMKGEASIDVIVDFEYLKHLQLARTVLSDKGHMVCCAPPKQPEEASLCWLLPSMEYLWEQYTLSLFGQATMFDFLENCRDDPIAVQEDLAFLYGLLQSRQLRPKFDRFICLSDVPRAHADLQKGHVDGFIVCEPWKV